MKYQKTCTICLEGVEIGRVINCQHIFHEHCLMYWFIKNNEQTCPTCRQKVGFPQIEWKSKKSEIWEQKLDLIEDIMEGKVSSFNLAILKSTYQKLY